MAILAQDMINLWRSGGHLLAEQRRLSAVRWAFGAWRCFQQRRRHYWTRRARQVNRRFLRRILREWFLLIQLRRAWVGHWHAQQRELLRQQLEAEWRWIRRR